MGGVNQQQAGGIAASPLGQAVRRAAQPQGLDNNTGGQSRLNDPNDPVIGDFGPGGNIISLPPDQMDPGQLREAHTLPYPQSPTGNVPMNWGMPQSRPPVPQGGKGIQQPMFSTPNQEGGIPENPNAFFFDQPKISEFIPGAFATPAPGDPAPTFPTQPPPGEPCPVGMERDGAGICRKLNLSR